MSVTISPQAQCAVVIERVVERVDAIREFMEKTKGRALAITPDLLDDEQAKKVILALETWLRCTEALV